MFRKEVLKKHINAEEINHIIGHDASIFIKEVLMSLLFLFLSYIGFIIISNFSNREHIKRIFAGIALYVLAKFIINFLNLYLDALVLSESGITLFMREGLLEHKTDIFERDRIETISYNQNDIWDKIFSKGDIMIRLEHGVEFPFDNVFQAKKQVGKIIKMKDKFVLQIQKKEQNELKMEDDKLSILIEALGEVVQEYMDKDKKKSNFD